MKKTRLVIMIAFIGTGFIVSQLQSCKHEPEDASRLPQVCFDTQVLPIFTSSCAMSGCHGGGGLEGFSATSYSEIRKHVKPGDPWGSKLYKIISSPNDPNMMPPKPYSALTKEQRSLIEVWILQGANDTKCDTTTTTVVPSEIDTTCFAQDILPVIQSSCAIKQANGTGCHDGTNSEARAFTDYNSLTRYINRSNLLQSKIYKVLSASGEDRMPPLPYNALTTQQMATFKTWISQGAVNSDCAALKSCDTTNTISFTSQVWPIIQNNCQGCHGASNPSGGISLTSYAQVVAYAEAPKLNSTRLRGAINRLSGFTAMPPSGKLSNCQIRTIELWMDQGKQNN